MRSNAFDLNLGIKGCCRVQTCQIHIWSVPLTENIWRPFSHASLLTQQTLWEMLTSRLSRLQMKEALMEEVSETVLMNVYTKTKKDAVIGDWWNIIFMFQRQLYILYNPEAAFSIHSIQSVPLHYPSHIVLDNSLHGPFENMLILVFPLLHFALFLYRKHKEMSSLCFFHPPMSSKWVWFFLFFLFSVAKVSKSPLWESCHWWEYSLFSITSNVFCWESVRHLTI